MISVLTLKENIRYQYITENQTLEHQFLRVPKRGVVHE